MSKKRTKFTRGSVEKGYQRESGGLAVGPGQYGMLDMKLVCFLALISTTLRTCLFIGNCMNSYDRRSFPADWSVANGYQPLANWLGHLAEPGDGGLRVRIAGSRAPDQGSCRPGSFVEGTEAARLDWESLIPTRRHHARLPAASAAATISFSASLAGGGLQFPLEEFRATCREVIDSRSGGAGFLQLGPASGSWTVCGSYILGRSAAQRGAARPGRRHPDHQRLPAGVRPDPSACWLRMAKRWFIEDPVYPGLRNAFQRGGARVLGAPVGADGVDVEALARLLEKGAAPARNRADAEFSKSDRAPRCPPKRLAKTILEIWRKRTGVVIVENDLYGALRYRGAEIPSDQAAGQFRAMPIQLGSFSKIAFPGLRVGWAIGPRGTSSRASPRRKERATCIRTNFRRPCCCGLRESGRAGSAIACRCSRQDAERSEDDCWQCAARICRRECRYIAPGRRNERVGPAAGAAGSRSELRDAPPARKCQLSSGPLFRGVASADARAAFEFRRLEAGGHHPRVDCSVLGTIV